MCSFIVCVPGSLPTLHPSGLSAAVRKLTGLQNERSTKWTRQLYPQLVCLRFSYPEMVIFLQKTIKLNDDLNKKTEVVEER